MKWFYDLKIGTRLIAAFIIVGAITAAVGYLGIASMGKIADFSKHSYQMETVGISYIKQANIDVLAVDRDNKNVQLSSTEGEALLYKAAMEASERAVDEDLDKAKLTITSESGKAMLEQAVHAWNASREVADRDVEMCLKERYIQKMPSGILSAGDLKAKLSAAEGLLVKLSSHKDDLAKQDSEEEDQTYQSSRTLLITLVMVAVAAGLGLGVFIARSISKPLAKVAETARNIALGDVNQSVDYHSGDEIGSLADSFRALVEYVRNVAKGLEGVAAGDMSVVVEPKSERDVLARSYQRTIGSLSGFIADMKHMSEEHNRGDIDVTIHAEKFEGAYRVMAQGVNDMVAGHITVKKKTMACVAEFGKGNFEAQLEKFPGKKAFINDTIELVRRNLQAVNADINILVNAAATGRVGTRADASKHQGDFRKIVEGVNQTLEAIVEPLKAMSENASSLASSSEELTAVSQGMASTAEETAVQANVVSAASEQVSRNVASVASASEEMQASIREISKNANDSARVAKNAVVVAQSTNETMKKLGASSQEIGNVIKVITSIAQQTNLLALNATIEAARAGEAGKGFAVVANEVKELAKQTAKATEDIGQKIEAIQEVTKGAVTAIEEIGTIINQINDISNSIASAVEEQTVTTNEIGRSVTEAAQGVDNISKNIGGVATAARNTTQGANDTKTASLELSEMAARLQASVSKFTF